MKRKSALLLMLVLVFVSSCVFGDVTREVIKNPDGTQEVIFYRDGKELAKELIGTDDTVITTMGKIPDGLVKEFFFDGAVREEVYYKNGKKEGVAKLYNSKGVVRGEFNFKKGIQDGLSKTYYDTGELLKEITFKNGKLEGVNREYAKDGTLLFEAYFKDDKQDGITTIYDPKGGKTVSVYDKGKLVSEKHYDANGKLKE
jgi:antitoxin component YwqK of YwqJK toxin-antitoxin module